MKGILSQYQLLPLGHRGEGNTLPVPALTSRGHRGEGNTLPVPALTSRGHRGEGNTLRQPHQVVPLHGCGDARSTQVNTQGATPRITATQGCERASHHSHMTTFFKCQNDASSTCNQYIHYLMFTISNGNCEKLHSYLQHCVIAAY